MKTSILRAGVRQRLIQQITPQSRSSGSAISRGFTLIELLVVVIIVGILASIALPGFLSQADKAKASSAKALVSSAVKECQVYLVDATSESEYIQQVQGTPEITLVGNTCEAGMANEWKATIESNSNEFIAVLGEDGVVEKNCTTGKAGCNSAGEW